MYNKHQNNKYIIYWHINPRVLYIIYWHIALMFIVHVKLRVLYIIYWHIVLMFIVHVNPGVHNTLTYCFDVYCTCKSRFICQYIMYSWIYMYNKHQNNMSVYYVLMDLHVQSTSTVHNILTYCFDVYCTCKSTSTVHNILTYCFDVYCTCKSTST
jgi:hypothetical protein